MRENHYFLRDIFLAKPPRLQGDIPIYLSVLSAFARFLSRRYLFCVIYISRQAAKVAKCIFLFILAPFAPLRDHNTFMREDNYFLRDIFLAKPLRAQRRFIVYVLRLSASGLYDETPLLYFNTIRNNHS